MCQTPLGIVDRWMDKNEELANYPLETFIWCKMQTVVCLLTLKSWLKQEAERLLRPWPKIQQKSLELSQQPGLGMDIRYRKRWWELKFAVSIIRIFFHPSVLHVYHTNVNLMTREVSQTEPSFVILTETEWLSHFCRSRGILYLDKTISTQELNVFVFLWLNIQLTRIILTCILRI